MSMVEHVGAMGWNGKELAGKSILGSVCQNDPWPVVRRKGENSDAGKGKNQTPSQPDFPEQCDACDAVCVLVVTLQRLTHKNQALATSPVGENATACGRGPPPFDSWCQLILEDVAGCFMMESGLARPSQVASERWCFQTWSHARAGAIARELWVTVGVATAGYECFVLSECDYIACVSLSFRVSQFGFIM